MLVHILKIYLKFDIDEHGVSLLFILFVYTYMKINTFFCQVALYSTFP